MKNIAVILLFLLFFCRENANNSKKHNNENPLEVQQSEIYIGKKFYEGDELNYFLYKTGGILTSDSLTSYSVYENDFQIIYSVERLISYEDVREYLIIDTLQLRKKEFIFKSYPLLENVILKNDSMIYKYDFKNEKIIKPNS